MIDIDHCRDPLNRQMRLADERLRVKKTLPIR
jgi:hypothetical protein